MSIVVPEYLHNCSQTGNIQIFLPFHWYTGAPNILLSEIAPNQQSVINSGGGGAQCLRIGVVKHNFVFDHILHFYQYPTVQLG